MLWNKVFPCFQKSVFHVSNKSISMFSNQSICMLSKKSISLFSKQSIFHVWRHQEQVPSNSKVIYPTTWSKICLQQTFIVLLKFQKNFYRFSQFSKSYVHSFRLAFELNALSLGYFLKTLDFSHDYQSICTNKLDWFKLWTVFVKIANSICPNSKMYLSKLKTHTIDLQQAGRSPFDRRSNHWAILSPVPFHMTADKHIFYPTILSNTVQPCLIFPHFLSLGPCKELIHVYMVSKKQEFNNNMELIWPSLSSWSPPSWS